LDFSAGWQAEHDGSAGLAGFLPLLGSKYLPL